MAHWIVEDHGFGGQYYRCSECRESWCDIFQDVSMEFRCPNCGATINDDETIYLDKKKRGVFNIFDLSSVTARTVLQAYNELEDKLVMLTGFDLETMVKMFAAGYTLQPPTYTSFEDLEKEATQYETTQLEYYGQS